MRAMLPANFTMEFNDLKNILFLIIAFCLLSASASAQEQPKAEVYGSYLYTRVATLDLNTNGFAFGGLYNLYRSSSASLGIAADLGTTYNNGSLFLYTAGPEVNYSRVFVRALAGGARASSGGFTNHGFGLLTGGGVKVPVYKKFHVRVGGDYQLSRFSGFNVNSFRLTIGTGFGF